MAKDKRDQLLAIGFFVFGIIFLYVEGISLLPPRITQNSVLLKGISLVLLSVAAILAGTAFENKRRISVISGIGLAIGLGFLYLPVSSILRGSTFHLLFACAIAFGMTTPAKRPVSIVSALFACVGVLFSFTNLSLHHLIVPPYTCFYPE